MRPPAGESLQRVCPRCSAVAQTTDSHCPWCGGGYRRRTWPALLASALLAAALVLAGVGLIALRVADEADARLDREVERVQRDIDRSFGDVRRDVRRELDRRLPAAP